MRVGDLVWLDGHSDAYGYGVATSKPRLSGDADPGDQYHVVDLLFMDGPYLACLDECEIVSESR